MTEGKEPEAFWKAIGGKKPYCANALVKENKRDLPYYKTRLFRISFVKNGSPTAEEIEHFHSKDLHQDGVFILDAYYEMFVWLGEDMLSTVRDIRLAMDTAMEYADLMMKKEDRLGRETCTMIFQGYEPVSFRGNFQAWDAPAVVREEGVTPPKKPKMAFEPMSIPAAWKKYIEATYPLKDLKAEQLPFGVDAGNLELFLEKASFEKHFGMSKGEFEALPKWKQTEKKKGSGLF